MTTKKVSKEEDRDEGVPKPIKAVATVRDQSPVPGQRKHYITLKGWHDNYATFDQNGAKGDISFHGTTLMLEFKKDGKEFKYEIKIDAIVGELIYGAK